MTNLIAIDNQTHINLRIDSDKAELHGEHLHLIPAVIPEFSNLAVQYPIVFTKNGDTGQFVCAAMLGFKVGENLFWQDGRWQGIYLPLQIQRQPFFVGDLENGTASETNSEQVVCVDFNSPTVFDGKNTSNEGEALFTETGEESDFFKTAKSQLAQLLQGEVANQRFIEKVTGLGLVQPLTLEITFANQEKTQLNGLYTIDREKLAQLSQVDIFELHQLGFLEAIYAMTTSLGQLYALIDKKNQRLAKQLEPAI